MNSHEPVTSSTACGICKIFVKRFDIAVKNPLVGIGNVEEFYPILVAASIKGSINDPSHDIYQLIFQAQGYHDPLALGEGDVSFHKDAAFADIEGASHGVVPLSPLIVNNQVIQKV